MSMIGRTISHYRIVEKLGEGGMGIVYKAIDTRLDRPVALKFLSASRLADDDRRKRFVQEAKAASALNHPNITTVYDIDTAGDESFMAMEFVSGKTLQQHIGRKGLPLADVVRYLAQVAEGLSAAHAAGIVHRDLKPSNIMVGDNGHVKLLDFGLAKLTEPAAAVATAPTMTAEIALTGRGTVMGTVEYMSPEQARGESVDQRTDVWAFGCVLYEALTGRMAFGSPSTSESFAKILEVEPDWTALPPSTPPGLRRLIRACLRKDLGHRLRHIEPLLIDITDDVSPPAPSRVRWWITPALAAALLVGSVGGWLISRWPANTGANLPVSRWSAPFASTVQVGDWNQPLLAIARDGSSLVYVGRPTPEAERQLFLRRKDRDEAEPLARTEGAAAPFYSPDGRSVGFVAEGRLKIVSLVDRGVRTVTAFLPATAGGGSWAPAAAWGGAWASDDTIIFSGQGFVNGLMRVPASGGTAEELTTLVPREETGHRWPSLSPSGRAVVYTTTNTTGPGLEESRVVAESLDTGRREVLEVDAATYATFAPDGRHLILVRAGAVLAVAFDPDRLRVVGSPVPLLDGVIQSSTGAPQLGVSSSAMVYLQGASETRQLVWVNRKGGVEPVADAPPRLYVHPRLSPDETKIVVAINEPKTGLNDIWAFDRTRGSLSRLTLQGNNAYPIWNRDGSKVFYVSRQQGHAANVFWTSPDGTGPEERVLTSEYAQVTESFAPDGTLLLVERRPETKTNWDILTIPPGTTGRTRDFLATPFTDSTPQISPSGRWVAHGSTRTGSQELVVHPYPNPDFEIQVSTGGGATAAWRKDEKELYYRLGNDMMVVDVTPDPKFTVGKPKILFGGQFAGIQGKNYDVTSDGRRFLMVQTVDPVAPKDISVVLNWMEVLKSRLSSK